MKSPVRAAAAAAAITGDGRTGPRLGRERSRNDQNRRQTMITVRPGLAGVLLPFPW